MKTKIFDGINSLMTIFIFGSVLALIGLFIYCMYFKLYIPLDQHKEHQCTNKGCNAIYNEWGRFEKCFCGGN